MTELIDVENIRFTFNSKCTRCGINNNWAIEGINIMNIIDSGIPICQECGEDLAIKDKCELIK